MRPSPPEGAVIVTGGNSGIGFACARRLAEAGVHVVLASRNRDASRAAVETIRRVTGSDAVEEMALDLGSLDGVRGFAKEIASRDLALRGLVCNAGLQFQKGPRHSAEGYELTFAVNHLGHFLLVHLLLERLLAHAPARILVVSSGVHDPARPTGMPKPAVADFDTLGRTGADGRPWNGRVAYVNSKLCNLWFAYELVRRLEASGLGAGDRPLSVNAFEPGLVPASGLARDYPAALRFLWDRVLPALTRFTPSINTPEVSGTALAELLLDPQWERASGRYFPSHTRFREAPSSPLSYDEDRARGLWEASVRMAGLEAHESPLAAR